MHKKIPIQELGNYSAPTTELSDLADAAVSVLGALLRAPSSTPQVQIAAARALLEATSRFRELSLREAPTPFGVHTSKVLQ